jgi:glutamine synthetase
MNESARSIGIRKEERRQAVGPPLYRHPEPAAPRFLSDRRADESSFEEGFGMDGSSIRGWAAINESDMLLIPDPTTAFMDPFAETPRW